jgi:hypothetical protein
MMKKNILIIAFVVLFAFLSFSQDSASVTTANSQITEVRLSGFEDASFWEVGMPIDQGVISKQSRVGVPKDVSSDEFKARDEEYGIPDSYAKNKVLGVKIEYIARGYNWFSIIPVKPIIIEGITQHITFWVAGRNYNHWIRIIIQDFYGRERFIYVNKLNFIGWKELKVSIPESIVQQDFHYADRVGIKFAGFVIECDPKETYGDYYLYLDELRALTDIFNEKTRDTDDMRDDW